MRKVFYCYDIRKRKESATRLELVEQSWCAWVVEGNGCLQYNRRSGLGTYTVAHSENSVTDIYHITLLQLGFRDGSNKSLALR